MVVLVTQLVLVVAGARKAVLVATPVMVGMAMGSVAMEAVSVAVLGAAVSVVAANAGLVRRHKKRRALLAMEKAVVPLATGEAVVPLLVAGNPEETKPLQPRATVPAEMCQTAAP
jgi:hypothetical protein